MIERKTADDGKTENRGMTGETKNEKRVGSWVTGSLLFGGLLDTGYNKGTV